MERVIGSKTTKIVMIALIILSMIISYVPKITYANNDGNEYVKFKTNWTNETDELNTLSNRTVYALFDMQLSGGIATGFRNMKIRAEDFNESEDDYSKPVAVIKINATANASNIINGSTSSTLEFNSPLSAGTAISGDIGIFVSTYDYASFETFTKKIKITLSGEYQDPITKETTYVENIIEPKVLTLNVTPDDKKTTFNSNITINEEGSGGKIASPRNIIDNSHAQPLHSGANCGWYVSDILGDYKLKVNTVEYAQTQKLTITLNRTDTKTNESKLNIGYEVNWGELINDFGEPVKSTNSEGADVYTFTKGTESSTFDKNSTFRISNKMYSVKVNYKTENTAWDKLIESNTRVTFTADSEAIGWQVIENASGTETVKQTLKTTKKNAENISLYSWTPGAHAHISVGYSPTNGGRISAEEIESFIQEGTLDLEFSAGTNYIWGYETSKQNGTITNSVPVLQYYSDEKQLETLELSNDEMVLKSIYAKEVLGDRTLDVYNGTELIWQGQTAQTFTAPEGANIKDFIVKFTDFINDDYHGRQIYNGYTATYTLSLEKLKAAGLSDTEIQNIVIIEQSMKVTDGTWINGESTARYYANDTDANRKSYLELDLGEYDCSATKENKTIKLSMYKNSEIIKNRDVVVKNIDPIIYVKLSDGFQYKINDISMTRNADIVIKNSSLVQINGEQFICIECDGIYDSSKLSKVEINIDLSRKLEEASLKKNQSITAYMLTENENYIWQTSNLYGLGKDGVIPSEVYYTTKPYSIVKTDSVQILTGMYTNSSTNGSGSKENALKFITNSTIKYYIEILNGSDALDNINIVSRLPVAGNKSITNTELDLDSTISLTNINNIKVYIRSGEIVKGELDSSNYTIGYSNNALANHDTVFDSTYTGYTNGISDVKTIQIKMADGYSLPSGTNLIIEYEMTMPDAQGITGETAAVSYIKEGTTEPVVLEPAAAYVQNGNPNGIVKVQKKFQHYAVGTAPEGVSLSGIQFKLVDMLTGETLVTTGTNAQGIVATNINGIAEFTEVPIGQYQIVEVSTIDGFKGIDQYLTAEIENGETIDIIAENKKNTSTLKIQKDWEDTNDKQGQVVFIVRSKETGNTYQVSQKTDEKTGIATIVGIPYGTYEIVESSGVYGWYADAQEIVIDEETETTVVENKLGKATLKITKTVPTGDSVQGLKFDINGTGYVRYTNKTGEVIKTDYSKTIVVGNDYTLDPNVSIEVSTDNKTATITLTDLYLGDYVIEEVEMPKIEETDIDRYVSVRRTIALKENAAEVNLNLTNRWKQGYLKIEKTAKLKTGENEFEDIGDLSEFKVRITGTSYYGTQVDETVNLDADGNSGIILLELGEYTVTEVPTDGYTAYYTVNQGGLDVQTTVAPTVKMEYGKTVTQKIYNEHTGVGYVKVAKTLEGITNPQTVVDAGIKFKVIGKNVAGGDVEEIINIDKIDTEHNVAYGISGAISVGGDYELQEVDTTVPEYFEAIDPVPVKLTTANTEESPLVIDAENKRAKGDLEISTQTVPEGGPLSGIIYKVTEVKINNDGTYTEIGTPQDVAGSNLIGLEGTAKLEDINAGNYLVEQIEIPAGWVKDVSQIVEVPSYSTGIAAFEITKAKEVQDTTVTISKQILNSNNQIASQEEIQKAKLNENESFEVKITNVDTNQEYYTFISGAENGVIKGLQAGTYQIEEQYKMKYVQAGYYLLSEVESEEVETAIELSAEKYTFTIGEQGTPESSVEIRIKNKINTEFGFGGTNSKDNLSRLDVQGESTAVATKSIIYIVDENGAALPGVQFKILDSNGQEVAIGTNGNIYTAVNRKLIVKGLPVGEYTLKNVSVPEGYLQPEDKQFTVYKDAVRVARVEIQRNIPRGSLQLSTTYLTESGDTRYASRSKYKVVDTATGELVKFTKTNTGDYIASNLETALEVISLKSGTVTLEGIKVGNYQIGLTDVTSGFGLTSTEPASVDIVENTEQKLNTEVKRAGIKQIDAGADHTMYLDYNGDLWLLGSGDEGLLYNGSNTGSKYYNPIPTKIQFPNDTKISKFSIAKDHIIAIDTKGKVWSWGSNNTYGELGHTNSGISKITCVSDLYGNPLKQAYDDGIKIIDVATTYDNSVLLDSNGKVWICGYEKNRIATEITDYLPICVSDIEGNALNNVRIKTLSQSKSGIISGGIILLDEFGKIWYVNYTTECISEKNDDLSSINMNKIISYDDVTYSIDNSGELWQINKDGSYIKFSKNDFGGLDIIDFAICAGTKAAIDSEGKVWTWGENYSGSLGNGRTDSYTQEVPMCISEDENSPIHNIKATNITAYTGFVMLDNNSNLWGWGSKSKEGEIGEESEETISIPRCFASLYYESLEYNLKFTKVVNSNGNTMAISEDGQLWGWGSSGYIIYGSSTTCYIPTKIEIPSQLPITDIVVETDRYDVCIVIDSDYRIWIWGERVEVLLGDEYKQAGHKYEITDKFTSKIVKLASSSNNIYAIDEQGRVWTVGNNSYGQLGDGTIITNYDPICISDNTDENLYGIKIVDIQKISIDAVMALDSNGKIWTWGEKSYIGISNEYETNIVGNAQTVPLCITDIEGSPLYNAYQQGIKIEQISGCYGAGMIDSDGNIWIMETTFNDQTINEPYCLSTSTEEFAQPFNINKNENLHYKIIKIQLGDGSLFIMDNNGNTWNKMYYSSNTSQKLYQLNREIEEFKGINIIEVSGIRALDDKGRIWSWDYYTGNYIVTSSTTPICLGLDIPNTLYNTKISEIIDERYVIDEQGKIWDTSYIPAQYRMDSEKVLEKQGIELQKDSIYRNIEYNLKNSICIVLDTNGKIWQWGIDTKTPVCLSDDNTSELYNVEIIDFKVFGVDSEKYVCAIDKIGKIYVWGYNEDGYIGTGTASTSDTSYQLKPTCLSNMEGNPFKLELQNDPTFKIQEIIEAGTTAIFVKDNKGRVWTWGRNYYGQLGNGTKTDILQPYCINTGVLKDKIIKQLDCTNLATIVLTEDGNMYACGTRDVTGLSTYTTTFKLINSSITGIEKFDILENQGRSPVVIAYGTNNVWTWGNHADTSVPDEPHILFSGSIKEIKMNYLYGQYSTDQIVLIDMDNKLWVKGRYVSAPSLGDPDDMRCITDMEGSPLQGIKIDKILQIKSNYRVLIVKDIDGNIWISPNGRESIRARDSQLGETAQKVYGEITEANIENIINGINAGILEVNGKVWKFNSSNAIYGVELNELKETNNITQYINNKAIDEDGNLYVWNRYTAVQPGAAITCLTTTPAAIDAPIGNGWTTVTTQY